MARTPNDRLFKELLETFFLEFLELLVPRLHGSIDGSQLEFMDKELFAATPRRSQRTLDLLARVRIRGRPGYVLIHVEHQAQPEARFERRMFRYFSTLEEKFDLPIYPIAVLSYSRPRNPQPATYKVSFPDLKVLDFRFRAIQLNRMSWRRFVRKPNPVASAFMARMAIAEKDRPRVKLECLRMLVQLKLDAAKSQLISGFVDTYLRLSRPEQERFAAQADSVLQPAEKEDLMEIVTSWMKEGIRKGRAEGRAEGRAQGRAQGRVQGRTEATRELVLDLLSRRVGTLPAPLHEAVTRLPLARLRALATDLLDFRQSSDLERWLAGH